MHLLLQQGNHGLKKLDCNKKKKTKRVQFLKLYQLFVNIKFLNPIKLIISSLLVSFFLFFGLLANISLDGGQQYLLASDDGVYVGHHNYRHVDTTPHKVLSLYKVTQIHTIETTETLLVLADRTLWEYPLDVVNGKPNTQPQGRLIQTHVPFFYVGVCLKRTMLCVPRISTLKSVISTFEAVKRMEIVGGVAGSPVNNTSVVKRSSGFLDRLLAIRSLTSPSDDLHLRKMKDCYVPCEAYAVELSATMMLITSSRGVIMVDMRTDKPQRK